VKQQRVYKTDLDFKAFHADYNSALSCGIWKKTIKSSYLSKRGLFIIYLKSFPDIRIQFTPQGFLMLHGGSIVEDLEVFKKLVPVFERISPNGFTVWLRKFVSGDKEKNEEIRELQKTVDLLGDAVYKGRKWYEKQTEEIAEHWVDGKPSSEGIEKHVAFTRRKISESEAQIDLEKGVYFNTKGQLFAINGNQKNEIKLINIKDLTSKEASYKSQ
jgi:hypothetical protein